MKSSNLIIPLSIVAAAFIIGAFTAGAIIYTSNSGNSQAAQGVTSPVRASIVYEEVTSDDYIRGSVDAPVKLIDYSDLECPFCKRHHETLTNLMSSYDGVEVAWVYRHFPLAQLHQKAIPEAVASECVAQTAGQEGFWSFIDTIYTETPSNDGLDLALLPEYAVAAGADAEAFQTCYENELTLPEVEADLADAQNAGGTGTPYGLLVSDAEITRAARNDIFEIMQGLGTDTGGLAVFAEDNHAVGVSGAIPGEALRLIIDRLLELNN